jgi:phospholipid-binding lipoprotein MlaA
MKIVYRMVIPLGMWLITFSGLCSAEPSASFSQTEASPSIIQVGKGAQESETVIPPGPSRSEESVGTIADPLEPINRVFFHVNDKFYFWFLKPVASGYKVIVPQGIRVSVRNFFSNVATPIRLVNCLFQGDFEGGGTEAIRFLLNTTFGIAGFFDLAKTEFNIEKREEDFGQTLGFWGIGPAFYIEWPILGPSSLRDTVGFVGDLFLNPRTYLITSIPADIAVWSYEEVNDTSLKIGEYEDLMRAALDPYAAVKDAYYQYRQSKIRKR